MKKSLIIIFFSLAFLSCKKEEISQNEKYQKITKGFCTVIVTDKENKAIDFYIYKPVKDFPISELKFYTNSTHEELHFYLVGDLVSEQFDKNQKFIKMGYREGSHFNNAQFGINNDDKIFQFSGNGMGVSLLENRHLDFVLNNMSSQFKHPIEVVEAYQTHFQEEESEQYEILANYNLHSKKLNFSQKTYHKGGGVTTEELDENDLHANDITWKKRFLEHQKK